MDDPPFKPATRPPQHVERALYFAFRWRQLLTSHTYALPVLRSIDELGLAAEGTHYLGQLGPEHCYCTQLGADVEAPPGTQFRDLRALYGRLRDVLFSVAGRAVQIVEWDRTHRYCGACGAATTPQAEVRARVCSACGHQAFPRLSPAIIVSVERGSEVLLARSPHFPQGIYSVLAGFVDPGESLEDAVVREVREEVGIEVTNIRYFGSQPWPFPNSLMVGFIADYAGGEIVPDGVEIEDAGFYGVETLPNTFDSDISISNWLLRDFCARHG